MTRDVVTGDVADLARHFVEARAIFSTSPLYRHLCGEVAADPQILALLAHRRAGQQPSYLFFGAVHDLLLSGVDHPLREYYPSLAGDAAREPAESGPVLRDFCAVYEAELDERIRTRLVQANVVRRAIALRYAMWAIGRTSRAPVHLVEVGASAGLLLLVDRSGTASATTSSVDRARRSCSTRSGGAASRRPISTMSRRSPAGSASTSTRPT